MGNIIEIKFDLSSQIHSAREIFIRTLEQPTRNGNPWRHFQHLAGARHQCQHGKRDDGLQRSSIEQLLLQPSDLRSQQVPVAGEIKTARTNLPGEVAQ